MVVDQASVAYFEDMARQVLEKCRLEQDLVIDGESQRLTLRVPSGDMKYKSFWVRDSAMMASCGLIPVGEIKGWLRLIAAGQNGPEPRQLANGLQLPPWSIADHINFDGRPVFYPGTYSSGNDQGHGSHGFYPPHDDPYYFVDLAYQYFSRSGDPAFFQEKTNGVSLLERLNQAYASYLIEPDSHLCRSALPDYVVDWGFCDVIVKSGVLLFPSLLRRQAARQLAEICRSLGNVSQAARYLAQAGQIQAGIRQHLTDASGWLLSASEIGRQKDVWGTAFAVWTGLLDGEELQRSLQVLADTFRNGSSVSSGYVRHILEGEDAIPGQTAWEQSRRPYNTYQNGGYWATPSGWYLYALAQYDEDLAGQMLRQLADHCRRHAADGAPYEWISRDSQVVDGRMYGASAALPYAAILRLVHAAP